MTIGLPWYDMRQAIATFKFHMKLSTNLLQKKREERNKWREEEKKRCTRSRLVRILIYCTNLLPFILGCCGEQQQQKITLTRLTLNKFEAKLMQCAQRAPRWCDKKKTNNNSSGSSSNNEKKSGLVVCVVCRQSPSQRLKKMSLIFAAIVRSFPLQKPTQK